MLTDTCAGVLETPLSMAEAKINEPKYFKTRILFLLLTTSLDG
jgi:hypothetical protein